MAQIPISMVDHSAIAEIVQMRRRITVLTPAKPPRGFFNAVFRRMRQVWIPSENWFVLYREFRHGEAEGLAVAPRVEHGVAGIDESLLEGDIGMLGKEDGVRQSLDGGIEVHKEEVTVAPFPGNVVDGLSGEGDVELSPPPVTAEDDCTARYTEFFAEVASLAGEFLNNVGEDRVIRTIIPVEELRDRAVIVAEGPFRRKHAMRKRRDAHNGRFLLFAGDDLVKEVDTVRARVSVEFLAVAVQEYGESRSEASENIFVYNAIRRGGNKRFPAEYFFVSFGVIEDCDLGTAFSDLVRVEEYVHDLRDLMAKTVERMKNRDSSRFVRRSLPPWDTAF